MLFVTQSVCTLDAVACCHGSRHRARRADGGYICTLLRISNTGQILIQELFGLGLGSLMRLIKQVLSSDLLFW